MRAIATIACALLASFSLAQDANIDNSKLEPLIGDWVGTTSFQDGEATAGTIKATKTLSGNWIRLELKFDLQGIGPVEAVALLCSDSEGVVEGHFFASMANNALSGKGKVTDKKLKIIAASLDGEGEMHFEFDMSVADALKFTATSGDDQARFLTGDYKKKK